MYTSVRHIDSARLMPIALTLMRTSFGPGAGISDSRNSRTSGPPAFANLIVRDIRPLGLDDCGTLSSPPRSKQEGYQVAVLPPLTLMIWPVMNDALLEARN